jgi:hypothetical protein
MLRTARFTLALALALVSVGCGDDGQGAESTGATGSGDTTEGGTPPTTGGTSTSDVSTGEATAAADSSTGAPAVELPDRLAVTADFLGGTLSLVDLDALVEGATRDDVVVGTVDLSAYAPGPLQVEVAADGVTAVVSVSPGFFGGLVGATIGAANVAQAGTLLLVDLQTQTVTAELSTAHVPMGIAIAPDGTKAYTANYGTDDAPGETMTVVDLATATVVEDIVIGNRPEQVALDESGALGIVNLAADGTIRVFETSDPAGTLSAPLPVSDDPSGVTFVTGTSRAVVASSLNPSTYQVIDVSDPENPTLLEDAPAPGGVPYAVTRIPGTTEVVCVASGFTTVTVVRSDIATDPSNLVWSHEITTTPTFPLSAAIDTPGNVALIDAPGANALLVVALDGASSYAIAWSPTNATGPTYVALAPPR